MNEYIEIRFRRNGRPWRLRRQVPAGVEFEELDPLQRTVGIGFDGADDITKYRMRRIRQLQGWDPNQFKLTVAVEDGAIVLRGVTPLALPEGRYRVQVTLEKAKTRGAAKTVSFVEDGHATCDIDLATDRREILVDLATCDQMIRRVLDASSVDGQAGAEWLTGDWRPTRKACLLNLLATLRSRPRVASPLVNDVQGVFSIGNDRVFAKVDRQFPGVLESLALDPKKPFYREGRPTSDVHLKLLESIPEPPDVKRLFSPEGLRSFRAEGRPSLQVVVAEPPAGIGHTYAEFDLDLGNPLQDVAGFVIHMGELLDSRITNHLDLRKDLTKTTVGQYLYYTILTPSATRSRGRV